MNPMLDQLLSRRSVRSFTGAAVSEADLTTILTAGQQAPTSVNGQQISLVVTRDKATIAKIAEIAGGQPQVAGADVFITVLMDYHRTSYACAQVNAEHVIEQSAEGIVVGAVDAGIMLNALQTAANSLGYGSTAIGGIRANPAAMRDLLGLPARTFPVVGLTLGVADESKLPQIKPRVPLASFAMHERYDVEAVAQGVHVYEQTLRQWWDAQGLNQMPSYCQSVATYYAKVYFRHTGESLEAQGFRFSDPSAK
ncbi:MAG: nitroreductase family protein [Aeromonas sp.]